MSTAAGSSSARLVTITRSPGPPTSRPSTTGVVGVAVAQQHVARAAQAVGPAFEAGL